MAGDSRYGKLPMFYLNKTKRTSFTVLSVYIYEVCFPSASGCYIKFWRNKIIIASGRYLSSLMLFGLLLGLVESILVATTPASRLCTVIQILAHLIMTVLPIPVFVKTLR